MKSFNSLAEELKEKIEYTKYEISKIGLKVSKGGINLEHLLVEYKYLESKLMRLQRKFNKIAP